MLQSDTQAVGPCGCVWKQALTDDTHLVTAEYINPRMHIVSRVTVCGL